MLYAQKIRTVAHLWGESTCQLGDIEEWTAATKHMKALPKALKNVQAVLSQDFDVPLQKAKDRGRKSDHWSTKLQHPGHRFQILRNSWAKIIKAWGGYSPKVEDSLFLELKKRWICKKLEGASVFADQHYSVGKKLFKDIVHYHTPHRKPSKKRKGQIATLTKRQQRENEQISGVRARIEHR